VGVRVSAEPDRTPGHPPRTTPPLDRFTVTETGGLRVPDAPTTRDEIDAWLITLLACDRLHTAVQAPDGTWLVARTPDECPLVLDDAQEALVFIAAVQSQVRREERREWA